MSSFWKIFLLILLNVAVSASVTYGVLYYWENVRNAEKPYQLVINDSYSTAEVPIESTAVPAEKTDVPDDEQPGIDQPSESIPAEEEPTSEPTPVIRGAKVEITIIRNPGSLSGEALRIVSNADEVVSLDGWTLEDANGNVLRFPNIQLLRKGIFVEVYSRSGHSTPYEIFWDREEAVWQSGETAVIRDMFGQIQATYRVP